MHQATMVTSVRQARFSYSLPYKIRKMEYVVCYANVCACLFVSECEDGHYGPNCERECQCLNGGMCQPTTGTCDCTPGYIGANCNISE